jgi:DNA-directed RNA polymerase subunit M/transcription elongation factor TFIIS
MLLVPKDFEVVCKKCGSNKVTIESVRSEYEDNNEIEIICEDCNNREQTKKEQ